MIRKYVSYLITVPERCQHGSNIPHNFAKYHERIDVVGVDCFDCSTQLRSAEEIFSGATLIHTELGIRRADAKLVTLR